MGRGESDADDFDAFVAAHGAALAQFAWVLAGGRNEGDELLQNTLVRVWRHWSRVRTAAAPDSYVRKMLINENLTRLRRRLTRREVPLDLWEPPIGDSPYDRMDIRIILEEALRRLPEKQRAVIALRYLEQRSERETAAVMGCTVGTVKSHSSRAMASLRRSPALVDLIVRGKTDE